MALKTSSSPILLDEQVAVRSSLLGIALTEFLRMIDDDEGPLGELPFPHSGAIDSFYRTWRSKLEDQVLSLRKKIEMAIIEIAKIKNNSEEYCWDDLEMALSDRMDTELEIEQLRSGIFILDELFILKTYKEIEIARGFALKQLFPSKKFNASDILSLYKNFPFLKKLNGAEAVDELRLICNSIKHSGEISGALFDAHWSWLGKDQLSDLNLAFERLRPRLGLYWDDFRKKTEYFSRKRFPKMHCFKSNRPFWEDY